MAITASLQAQKTFTSDLPTAIFKFSPQHMFLSTLAVSGEMFNEKRIFSNQISLQMKYREGYDNSASGFAAEYMFRAYPGKFKVEKKLGVEKAAGYYAGFFAQGFSFTEKDMEYIDYPNPNPTYEEKEVVLKNSGIYGGFVFGRQISIGDYFYADFYLGAGIRMANASVNYEETYLERDSKEFFRSGYSGMLPKMGFSFGIGF